MVGAVEHDAASAMGQKAKAAQHQATWLRNYQANPNQLRRTKQWQHW
jgi:hypothetical protein